MNIYKHVPITLLFLPNNSSITPFDAASSPYTRKLYIRGNTNRIALTITQKHIPVNRETTLMVNSIFNLYKHT